MEPDSAPTPVFEVLSGTPEADTLVVTPVGKPRGDFFQTQGIRDGFAIIYPNSASEPPEFEAQTFFDPFGQLEVQSWQDKWFTVMGIPIIVDESADSEVDILVYQEQERATYLEEFQAPTARSYTYIEDFEPINDYIVIGGDAYQYDVDDSEFRITDDSLCEIPFVCF